MSSVPRSTRSSLRRKVVLPVTVIRRNGLEKQLAHTLDLTEGAARLGGLCSLLEPGEVIEVLRGTTKAKFQVFWMGAPGSAMEGQAGVRSLELNKSIWGVNLPADETDVAPNGGIVRKEMPPVRTEGRTAGEKRWHTRFECSGGASIRAEGSAFPVHGQAKDIAQGGVYVETTTPLPVNTAIHAKMNVEGVAIESLGVVRTSYPMVGMGISFQKITPENQAKIGQVIQNLRRKAATPKNMTEPAETYAPANHVVSEKKAPGVPALHLDAYPVRVLANACQEFVADFDAWKSTRLPSEIEELRLAVSELQLKLSPLPQIEFTDFRSTSGHA
jgi:hypothetical protein